MLATSPEHEHGDLGKAHNCTPTCPLKSYCECPKKYTPGQSDSNCKLITYCSDKENDYVPEILIIIRHSMSKLENYLRTHH